MMPQPTLSRRGFLGTCGAVGAALTASLRASDASTRQLATVEGLGVALFDDVAA